MQVEGEEHISSNSEWWLKCGRLQSELVGMVSGATPRRIGFIVNPIAGMGGRVGLKGTDGKVEEAKARGAVPEAPDRARRAVEAIETVDSNTILLTWGEPMGEQVVGETTLQYDVLGHPTGQETAAADTKAAVAAYLDAGVDLILFVGGDGTAVDVAEAIEEAKRDVPMLGVPAGVKIFSSVFAVTPEDAGEIAVTFERKEQREVADLDEDAYREGEVDASVKAIATVPVADAVQSSKQLQGGSVEGLVDGVVESIEPGTTYFLGPGGTLKAIKEALGFDGSPLGVDIWRDGACIHRDAAADDLTAAQTDRTVIVVSPIGGQGFIFGRGNQQFAPSIIAAAEIWVVASPAKLNELDALRVDTGDPAVDDSLRGWIKVQTGRYERRMMQIV